MDFSKIKLVVTDMDGTLLNSNHQLSQRFRDLFEELHKNGIGFAVASGRQAQSIADKLGDLAPKVSIIAENGAIVHHNGEELLVKALPPTTVGQMVGMLQKLDGSHAMLCGKNHAYLDSSVSGFLPMLKEYYSNYSIVDDISEVQETILKVAIFHPVDVEKYLLPSLEQFKDDTLIKVSGKHWIDINRKDANKGDALKLLLEQLNLTKENAMVFGDYYNDLEMIRLSPNSFAMGNAMPEVKKAAQFETASNDEFGVERVLEKLLSV